MAVNHWINVNGREWPLASAIDNAAAQRGIRHERKSPLAIHQGDVPRRVAGHRLHLQLKPASPQDLPWLQTVGDGDLAADQGPYPIQTFFIELEPRCQPILAIHLIQIPVY